MRPLTLKLLEGIVNLSTGPLNVTPGADNRKPFIKYYDRKARLLRAYDSEAAKAKKLGDEAPLQSTYAGGNMMVRTTLKPRMRIDPDTGERRLHHGVERLHRALDLAGLRRRHQEDIRLGWAKNNKRRPMTHADVASPEPKLIQDPLTGKLSHPYN